jgi:uncharacterized protein (TIGR02147 family)
MTVDNRKNPFGGFLHAELAERTKKNPRYSLRQFANFLKISAPQLSQILSGKRRLTRNQLIKIANRLELSRNRLANLLQLVVNDELKTRILDSKPSKFETIPESTFAHISDWIYYAVLSLSEVNDNQSSPAWVAQRLGITIEQAVNALARLSELGLITIENNQLRQCVLPITTTTDIPSAVIVKRHEQVLNLAIEKLHSVAPEMRDFSSITMAVDPEKLPLAKTLIEDARRRICEELESGLRTEVFTLNIQLFPLTKLEKARL